MISIVNLFESAFFQNKKYALIVIDIVNSCADERWEFKDWGLTFNKVRKMVPNLINFISIFKQKKIGPVIYVKGVKWIEDEVAKNVKDLYNRNPDAKFYVEKNPTESAKFYKVVPEKDDIVITKNTYDAFSNPELDKYLKKNKIDHLIITGIFSDGCVHATINSAFSKGYHLTILKDLTESMDRPDKQKIQKYFKEQAWPYMFGDVISSKDFINSVK